MLILTRKIRELIMIGDDITVTLVDIKNNQASIGISAPKNIAVHREEIYERIQKEKGHNQFANEHPVHTVYRF